MILKRWKHGIPGLIAILMGLLYWPLEALIHVVFFDAKSLFNELFHTSPNEAWMRTLIALTFIAFGCYLYRQLSQRQFRLAKLEMLEQALNHIGEGIIITNYKGDIEYVNPAFETTTGYTAAEALGHNPRILQSGRQGRSFYHELWLSIQRHGHWKGRIWNRRKNGEEYPEELHICAIRNADGDAVRYIGVFFDISEQLHLEDQLRHSQKMEAIGTLVGGIAHDFNNILTSMTGNLFLVRMELEELPLEKSEELQQKLDLIENEGFRAAAMIQHLLAFARKRIVQMKPFDFTSSMQKIIDLARPSLGRSIDVDVQLGTQHHIVLGDENQLQEVMINLLNNAADAVRGKEHPRIAITLEPLASPPKNITGNSIDAPFLHILIADNGEGIAQEDLPRIFEPFYTTKDVGSGTGLGLSMAFGAIQMHHGYIDINSEKGCGCNVSLYLPLHQEKEQASPITPSANMPLVLLLEANIQYRTILEQQLHALGCEVLSVSHWQEARSCLEDQSVHLLLADEHSLIGDAADSIEQHHPELTLRWLSEEPTKEHCLQKPVPIEALKQLLDQLPRE